MVSAVAQASVVQQASCGSGRRSARAHGLCGSDRSSACALQEDGRLESLAMATRTSALGAGVLAVA